MSEATQHLVIIGDSTHMSQVADESVHFVVTSPPYFDARDYGSAEQIGHGDSLENYLGAIGRIFAECFRVLRCGRKFCLNISDLPVKGPNGVTWLPLGPMLLQQALDAGFELADRVIWDKTPKKGFHYGSLPYPPSPLICDSMEYIYILRKPGKPGYQYLLPENKEKSKMPPREYQEFTKQIWTLRRVRLKDNLEGHIAPFPVDLPYRCIRLYSFAGDTVLDPFAGSGTTGEAAIWAERNSIMYEINPEYLRLIKQKLENAVGLIGTAEITYLVGADQTKVRVGVEGG